MTTYLRLSKPLSITDDEETHAREYQEALQEYYDYLLEKCPKVKVQYDIVK